MSAIEFVVRSTDLDMLGHVNNAKYLEYLEWGRIAWLRKNGIDMEKFGHKELSNVVVNININYNQEVVMDEKLRLITSLVRFGKSSYMLRQEIYNEKNQCVTDAEVTLVIFNKITRKSAPIPDKLRERFREILAEQRQEAQQQEELNAGQG